MEENVKYPDDIFWFGKEPDSCGQMSITPYETLPELLSAINSELPDDKMVVMGEIKDDGGSGFCLRTGENPKIGLLAKIEKDESIGFSYCLSPSEQETFRQKVANIRAGEVKWGVLNPNNVYVKMKPNGEECYCKNGVTINRATNKNDFVHTTPVTMGDACPKPTPSDLLWTAEEIKAMWEATGKTELEAYQLSVRVHKQNLAVAEFLEEMVQDIGIDRCPVCLFMIEENDGVRERCSGCSLKDKGLSCAIEWEKTFNAKTLPDFLEAEEAMIARLEKEIENIRGESQEGSWRYVVKDGLVHTEQFCNGVWIKKGMLPGTKEYWKLIDCKKEKNDICINCENYKPKSKTGRRKPPC